MNSKIAAAIVFAALVTDASWAMPAYVDQSGNVWRQVTDTVGLTWNEVNSTCPSDGTRCSGIVNSVDLTGWIWASPRNVQDLFMSFSPGQTSDNTSSFSIHTPGSLDPAKHVLDNLLMPTTSYDFPVQNRYGAAINGWTSDSDDSAAVVGRIGYNGFTLEESSSSSHMIIYLGYLSAEQRNMRFDGSGYWLYQPANGSDGSAVPEPPVLSLVIAGLGLLRFFRSRQRSGGS